MKKMEEKTEFCILRCSDSSPNAVNLKCSSESLLFKCLEFCFESGKSMGETLIIFFLETPQGCFGLGLQIMFIIFDKNKYFKIISCLKSLNKEFFKY